MTAVVTVAANRDLHLRNQLRALRATDPGPELHVVVAMGDPAVAEICAEDGCLVVDMPAAEALPLAAARNVGAREALRHAADALVFLDVDCLPAPDLLRRYADAVAREPGALLSGPVTYLPQGARPGDPLRPAAHPGRPDPPDGTLLQVRHTLFWSLSFALSGPTWQHIGGFDERYVGYGAEDTDFAQSAASVGVPHLMVGGAHAYHQWHPTTNPPLQHLDDLLRNGALFARRWGWWPMSGWFAEFQRLGVVRADGAGGWMKAEGNRVSTMQTTPRAEPARRESTEGPR